MSSLKAKRKRLIELLSVDMSGCEGSFEEEMADYLLANGIDVRLERGREEPLPSVDLSYFKGKGLNELQMQEIAIGHSEGLNTEEINVYAKPEFNHYQMREIRVGITNGLNQEQLSVYATPKFSVEQMNVIRVGLELGMTIEEVNSFANPELSWQEMFRARNNIREKTRSNLALSDTIKQAKSMSNNSGAPVHYKQEDFQL